MSSKLLVRLIPRLVWFWFLLTCPSKDSKEYEGKVPVLVDGATTLDSAVDILKLLAGKDGVADHFYPKDAAARAAVDDFIQAYQKRFPDESSGEPRGGLAGPLLFSLPPFFKERLGRRI